MASENTSGRSVSTTLDDIIDELKLNYDSSLGTLDGDSVMHIPSLNILLNVSKLLGNLEKQLKTVEKADSELLRKIKLAENDDALMEEEENEENAGTKRGLEESDGESSALTAKRSHVSSLKNGNVDEADEEMPPVQIGSYTQSNDTRLKNPKSEFVPSQTLPAEAIAHLGLFSEDNNGLETHGKEYLKKKYGVASYPESDLLDMLPGPIPDVDFSKTKAPSNQVQFTTFQSYLESYFRPFASDDVKFLKEKYVLPPGFERGNYDPSLTPYMIPKLGPYYATVWDEEDPALGAKLNLSQQFQQINPEAYKPRGSIDQLSDDKLYTEDVTCGPLSSRLLSAIMSSHEGSAFDDENYRELNNAEDQPMTQLDTEDDYNITSESNDFYSMEERLKRELKCIGIFMNMHAADDDIKAPKFNGLLTRRESSIVDTDDWILNKEDDEVSAEMRTLQKELKGAVQRNKSNKRKLISVVEDQLAYQEYCTILEDLDKQVDQAYLKRLRAKNKKKKTEVTPQQQQSANSGLRALLDKRRRWIDNIGKLFKAPEIMKRVPSESVLKSDSDDGGDDNDVEVAADAPILEK